MMMMMMINQKKKMNNKTFKEYKISVQIKMEDSYDYICVSWWIRC